MPEKSEAADAIQVMRDYFSLPQSIDDTQAVGFVMMLVHDLKLELAVAKARLEMLEKKK
jgi:hypothetical protein